MTRRALTPEEIADLCAMYSVASKVRGFTPLDHPARQTARDLAATYASLVSDGVSASAIARAVGCSLNAVGQRMSRHGFRPLPPSMAGVAYRHLCSNGHVKAGAA